MSMAARRIDFRADGNARMGMGHLARCLVLAKACEARGWSVRIITSRDCETRVFEEARFRGKVLTLEANSPGEFASCVGRGAQTLVVLDGYHLSIDHERSIRDLGSTVVTLDDNAEREFAADVVLNGNVHASRLEYRTEPQTRVFAGSDYFILSEEVARPGAERDIPKEVKRVLVTMGGADPHDETRKVLEALNRLRRPDLEVTAIAGAANPRFEELQKLAGSLGYQCVVLPSTNRIGELMRAADLGISAGGRVATEMLYVGLPSLKIVVAENQRGLVEEMAAKGAAINLGWHEDLDGARIAQAAAELMADVALRRRMSDKGRSMVDGKGTERILKLFEELHAEEPA